MAYDLVGRVESLGTPKVLVIGDIILDRYIWGDVERVSPEAPVPVFVPYKTEDRLGGAGAVAAMLATLGAEVTLQGLAGIDETAFVVGTLAKDLGISRRVYREEGRPTTVKERYVGRSHGKHVQQLLRVDRESCKGPEAFTQRFLKETLTSACSHKWDAILVSDYGKGVCTQDTVRAAVEYGRERAIPVVVDPSASKAVGAYYGATALTPNRREAAQLCCDGIPVERLWQYSSVGCVFTTLDKDGISVSHKGGYSVLPARPREVYDVTGAGDMVLAVIGLCLASGASYEEAAALANVAGGLSVERFGAALLTRQELVDDIRAASPSQDPKLFSLSSLVGEVAHRRALGQTIVMTNGCFDCLHPGHLHLLTYAKDEDTYLIVAVNSDDSVRRLKGERRPIQPLAERVKALTGLRCVDAVIVFKEDTPLALIQEFRPDVLVKGDDYTMDQVVGRDSVLDAGGKVVLVPRLPGYCTSRLLRT
jgi:D-beta-D-heptose 7-phosphate kinase/D-beta-D-heptose 1-phosphate adenosyltransferase